MNEEEAVKIFDLVVKGNMLPTTIDKLVPLSFIGSAAVKFYQAKVKLMNQLGMSEAQRKATLADGQDAGEMLLNIEARIGELYESLPAKPGVRGPDSRAGGKTATIEKAGIDQFKAMRAQTIHRNPAAVAAIIKEARENEDIPTKTAVLNKIRADKEETRRKEYEKLVKKNRADNSSQTRGEALTYLSKLREVVLILPPSIPKDGWTEGSFAEAKAMAEIIIKRLGGWNE